ncbi:ceramidase domain-containing protein [Aquimarina sp. SS2-1]|uniref:ceramidase domain-containing protein n=1 Tax=Aquimarina besae TaxID=3342247 RepID=UPI00366AB2EA
MLTKMINDFNIPNDTGPIYQETIMGRLPVEPFNTISNLVFLIIIIYFSIRVYRLPKQHLFIALSLPILTIGFIGGTMFHGTRSHQIWLFMDWVPIMILCMSAVFYFIFKLYKDWKKRLLAFILIFGVSFAVRMLPIPMALRISLGYVITAITVLLPIILYLIKTNGRYKEMIILAFLFFTIAISFRSADTFWKTDIFYMGTHWLWHVCGGISVFFLMLYVYRDNLKESKILQEG